MGPGRASPIRVVRHREPSCEQMMSCLAILLGLPLVATLIVLFDDDGPWGQDRRWQYS
jgi:hypothetical protein